jgi:hypothetical protein
LWLTPAAGDVLGWIGSGKLKMRSALFLRVGLAAGPPESLSEGCGFLTTNNPSNAQRDPNW